jgi:hypothetical protein
MFKIHEQVIHETSDGETMLVRLDSGNYYSLNRSGSFVWECFGNGMSQNQIEQVLSSGFGLDAKEAKEHVSSFLGELISEDLIVQSCGSCGEPSLSGYSLTPGDIQYEPPRLSKYSDMKELLILDPIHDVSDAGWPNPKPEKGVNA